MNCSRWMTTCLSAGLMSALLACQGPISAGVSQAGAIAAAPASGEYVRLSPAEVQARQAQGEQFLIVDVRAVASYETQHIEGAINVPVEQIATRIADLPKERHLLLYCTCPAEGSAIAAATVLRNQHGFSRLAVLVGGMNAWASAGLPVVRPKPVAPTP